MFDLKSWQKQLEKNLSHDMEKSQIWHNQIKPVVAELLPVLDNIQQNLEQQAKSRIVVPQYEIACGAVQPHGIRPGFSSMLPPEVQKQILMKTAEENITASFFSSMNRLNVLDNTKHLYLHGGICYGDEVLLQQQTVQVFLHNGEEQCVVTGKYVHHRAADEQIEQLLKQAKRVGETIPFIVDFYAKRFYVLQLQLPSQEEIKHWKQIERIEVVAFSPEIEEQVNLQIYEEPVWNIEKVTLKNLPGRKLLPNGLHRRKFEDSKKRMIIPIVPESGNFCSLTEEAATNKFVVTVELPVQEDTLYAYVVQPICDEKDVLHNKAIQAMPSFGKEPSIADLHAIRASFAYFKPLTIHSAKLEVLPAQSGDLWHRDCLVLYVNCEVDLYTSSRLRALQQCILQHFAYAACRVEQVGDVNAK